MVAVAVSPTAATGFGQPAATPTGGLFGSTTTQQPATGFGATTGGGLFGAKPATTGFGAPATQTPAFGAAQPAASPFGAAKPAFGAPTGGGLFGRCSAMCCGLLSFSPLLNPTYAGEWMLSRPHCVSPGGTTPTTTPAATGGLFGTSQPSTLGGGLFGSTAQPQAGAGTSLFGGTAAAKPAFGASTTTLPTFGATNTTSGLGGATAGACLRCKLLVFIHADIRCFVCI
jgi:hypothetical protein